MANIVVRLPWPNIADPTQPVTVTLADQGDGTFAPVVQAAATAGGAPTNATYITKTASAGLSAEIAIGTGTSGQILQSDGTNPGWANKRIASNVATNGTVGDVVTALIAAGLMASA